MNLDELKSVPFVVRAVRVESELIYVANDSPIALLHRKHVKAFAICDMAGITRGVVLETNGHRRLGD